MHQTHYNFTTRNGYDPIETRIKCTWQMTLEDQSFTPKPDHKVHSLETMQVVILRGLE